MDKLKAFIVPGLVAIFIAAFFLGLGWWLGSDNIRGEDNKPEQIDPQRIDRATREYYRELCSKGEC